MCLIKDSIATCPMTDKVIDTEVLDLIKTSAEAMNRVKENMID